MIYELYNEEGELIGVYKDEDAAKDALFCHPEYELVESCPTLEGFGHCVDVNNHTTLDELLADGWVVD